VIVRNRSLNEQCSSFAGLESDEPCSERYRQRLWTSAVLELEPGLLVALWYGELWLAASQHPPRYGNDPPDHAGWVGPAAPELRYKSGVTPEQIRQLRAELNCSTRELAMTLGVEQLQVLAWEAGELFPTKRYVERMNELRVAGPAAVVRPAKRDAPSALERLADPAFWAVVQKLALYPELYDRVAKLAESFDSPKS
jgi:transcriptional regulator with XRE-family HTH domain